MTDDEIREAITAISWRLAMREYDLSGNTAPLDRMLVQGYPVPAPIRARLLGGLKRKRGRPAKMRVSPEHVVVMVARAVMNGYPNSNSDTYPRNPAFAYVADGLGVSVETIRDCYDKIPDGRRSQIEADFAESLQVLDGCLNRE